MTDLVQKIADGLYVCPGCGSGLPSDNNGCNDCGYEGDGGHIKSVGEFMRGKSYPEAGHLLMNEISPAYMCRVVDAIRQALADAGGAVAPVAWLRKNGFRFNGNIEPQDDSELPLYTHPAPTPTDTGRVAELERVKADWERLYNKMAARCAEAEAQLADSREREGRMREDVSEAMRLIDAGFDSSAYGVLVSALAADKEKNDE